MVDYIMVERNEMFGKLSAGFLAVVLALTLAQVSVAEASVRKTNSLSKVRTQIVSNFNHTGTDVCFVYNANNAAVSILISVFPTGTLVLAADTQTFPMVLGPFGGARVFSWSPLTPASEYCKVMVVR
jgi:hypothetical protein